MNSDLRIGDWRLEAELNQLVGPDTSAHLEPRTTAVLLDLAAHAGQVRSREQLLAAVWGDAFVGEAVLTHCIWELRKAVGDDAKNPKFIQTVPRRGYRLVAPVLQVRAQAVRTLVAVRSEPAAEAAAHHGELIGRHSGHRAGLTDDDPALLWAVFERPAEAIHFSLALQRRATGARIGVHLDEVEIDERPAQATGESGSANLVLEISGAATGLVSGLAWLAGEGQILLTRGVFDVARRADTESFGDGELRWLAHGGYLLAGMEMPLRVFEVGFEGSAPLEPPLDGPGGQRATGESTVLGWRPAPGLKIPQRPNWLLQRQLGEGGFGEVWLTRHDKTDDLRVFKFCVELDRLRALQREVTLFRLLKRALGRRRDIIRVLDWNFDTAPYFLELEYIEGGSFGDWAQSEGGLAAVALDIRLEIVALAADALAAAHSIGVLHKDVKPGNVLIAPGRGGKPRVTLSDFGIGGLTDQGRLSAAGITALGLTETPTTASAGSQAGTQRYLAPELFEGRVASIQSDIYALGVVVYQVAVGSFEAAMAPGWRRQIEDPLLAEDIARFVDVDPARRPASVTEVAESLRTLEQRRQRREAELQAREQAERDRQALERAQQRRRWMTRVTALAVAVLAVVSVLALAAVRARHQANRHLERAEDLVSFMLGDLRGTLQSVGRLDAMEGTVEEVLAYFASFDATALDDEALARHSAALRQIGDVRRRLGDLESAEQAFAEASRLARSLVDRDPRQGEWQAALADCQFWLGDVRRRQGDPKAALEALETHRAIYQQVVEQQPSHRTWRLELAYGHANVGRLQAAMGQYGALDHMLRSRQIIAKLAAEEPQDRELRWALAAAHHQVGFAQSQHGKLDEALESYRGDLAEMSALVEEWPNDRRYQARRATAEGYVGLALWQLGRAEEALPNYRAEMSGFEQLSELDPVNTSWARNLAVVRSKVARVEALRGETATAMELLVQSRAELQQLVNKDPARKDWHRDLAGRRLRLGRLHLQLGDTEAALAEAEPATANLAALRVELRGDWRILDRLAEGRALLAEIFSLCGRETEAAEQWKDVLAVVAVVRRDPERPRDLDLAVRALIGLGRLDEAQPIIDQLHQLGYRSPEFEAFIEAYGPPSPVSISSSGSQ